MRARNVKEVHSLATLCATENRWPRDDELEALAPLTGKNVGSLRILVALLGDDIQRGHLPPGPRGGAA